MNGTLIRYDVLLHIQSCTSTAEVEKVREAAKQLRRKDASLEGRKGEKREKL